MPRLLAVALGSSLPILWFSVVSTVDGWTGWPWEPFRFWVALVAVTALIVGDRQAVAVALAGWAVVASPLALQAERIGFVDQPPGEVLARGVPNGVHRFDIGPIPAGQVFLRGAEKRYLNGEGGFAQDDLVAWSATWLPWPHLDRTTIIGLDGSTKRHWSSDNVYTRRDGSRLLVQGPRSPDGGSSRPELYELSLGITDSRLTWGGWIAVLAALTVRLALQRRRRSTAPA